MRIRNMRIVAIIGAEENYRLRSNAAENYLDIALGNSYTARLCGKGTFWVSNQIRINYKKG